MSETRDEDWVRENSHLLFAAVVSAEGVISRVFGEEHPYEWEVLKTLRRLIARAHEADLAEAEARAADWDGDEPWDDDESADIRYRADMKDAGRGHLLK